MRKVMRTSWMLIAGFLMLGCPPDVSTSDPPKDTLIEADGDAVRSGDGGSTDCEGEPSCLTEGICADQPVAKCVGGEWTCDYTVVEGYEETEVSCDGLDNDCDGVPDDQEDFGDLALADTCPDFDHGVCAKEANKNAIAIACEKKGGTFSFACDFSGIDDWVEDERFYEEELVLGGWCDGEDNDCDGETDEDLENAAGLDDISALEFVTCKSFLGPCGVAVDTEPFEVTGDVIFTCDEGVFLCNYDEMTDYEEEETLCDGVDNDCDGETDEVDDVNLSDCPLLGVCAGQVVAACMDGEWLCDTSALLTLADYESTETRCDGLDNDCDGEVDEGLHWTEILLEEDCGDEVDNDDNGKTDCEEPGCAAYWEDCGGTPPAFEACPITEKLQIGGKKVDVPVLNDLYKPVMPGVCAPDPFTGESSVRLSCEPYDVDNDDEPDTSFFLCNYDEVEHYAPVEAHSAGSQKTWCDGRDNDCNGVVDDPDKLILSGDELALTPCRFAGECANNTLAYCNRDEDQDGVGDHPGQWFCEYGTASPTVEFGACEDSNDPHCQWAELSCDGLDNDCDGSVDELLNGLGYGLQEACALTLNVGVCTDVLLNTTCGVVDEDSGEKGWLCDYSGAVEFGYQPEEDFVVALCDGLDNDCDGVVDEDIIAFTPSELAGTGCKAIGVCALGTIATCNLNGEAPGEWYCDYDQVPGYGGYDDPLQGLRETLCDGKDNDCDGLVDEELSLDFGPDADADNPKYTSGCPYMGVCEGKMKWYCGVDDLGAPTFVCDPQEVPLYEAVETLCDAFDNDCDGELNEDLNDPGPDGADCTGYGEGLCAEYGIEATCVANQWVCSYENIPNYENKESLCDGLDNDCNGQIDEELDPLTSAGNNACKFQGVCDPGQVVAICSGTLDGWTCNYSAIESYEVTEQTCDGLDNDCDGAVDQFLCGPCDPCDNDPERCFNLQCHSDPYGDNYYCASGETSCVYKDSVLGICKDVPNGGAACADSETRAICSSGSWYIVPQKCVDPTPSCHNGVCKVCIPNKKQCAGNQIQTCAISGNEWLPGGTCGAGFICLGEGNCVSNDEIETTSLSAGGLADVPGPRVAGLASGGFVVTWTTEDSAADGSLSAVLARLYDNQLEPTGSPFVVNTTTSGAQNQADVASFPAEIGGGFVVTWRVSGLVGDTGWGIAAQLFNASGEKVGDEIHVNTTTASNQEEPAVTAYDDGSFLVVWHSLAGEDDDLYGVYGQRFDPDGDPVGEEFLLNTTTASSQRSPAVTYLTNGGFVGAWSGDGQDSQGTAVIGQIFGPTAVKVLGEIQMNSYEASSQKSPRLAALRESEDWFVAVWESTGQDLSGLSVIMGIFDSSGQPEGGEVDLAQNIVGKQQNPSVAVLNEDEMVVVWESQAIDGDDMGISVRLFSDDGSPILDEAQVNQYTTGAQEDPDVAYLKGNGYVVVWTSYENNEAFVRARVFKR